MVIAQSILIILAGCFSHDDEEFVGIYNYSADTVFVHLDLFTPLTNVSLSLEPNTYMLDWDSKTPDNYSRLVISNAHTLIHDAVPPDITPLFSYSETRFVGKVYFIELR